MAYYTVSRVVDFFGVQGVSITYTLPTWRGTRRGTWQGMYAMVVVVVGEGRGVAVWHEIFDCELQKKK